MGRLLEGSFPFVPLAWCVELNAVSDRHRETRIVRAADRFWPFWRRFLGQRLCNVIRGVFVDLLRLSGGMGDLGHHSKLLFGSGEELLKNSDHVTNKRLK